MSRGTNRCPSGRSRSSKAPEYRAKRRFSMSGVAPDFKLEGVSAVLDCPTLFQVSVTRFADGLNMDSFARSMSMVFHTELNATWLVKRYLGPREGGHGGRFDFRKAG